MQQTSKGWHEVCIFVVDEESSSWASYVVPDIIFEWRKNQQVLTKTSLVYLTEKPDDIAFHYLIRT